MNELTISVSRLLGCFQNDPEAELRLKDLTTALAISHGSRRDFRDALTGFIKDGLLVKTRTSRYRLGPKAASFSVEPEETLEDRIQEILRKQDIATDFPDEVIEQAKAAPEDVTEIPQGYRDLRSLAFCTIDPATANDFDDALAAETLDHGGVRLYVAIADVTHYVTAQSPMDHEALKRCTSVYFPGQVVPMLPHKLTNGLCSLRPKTDRLAMVVEQEYSRQGELNETTVYPAVIHSKARLTYEDLFAWMQGRGNLPDASVEASLTALLPLYYILLDQRKERGTLELEAPEPWVVLDDSGKPVDIRKRDSNHAHKLVEECMIAANRAVATFCLKNKIPALYRIHQAPDEDKLSEFLQFCASLHLPIPRGQPTVKKLSAFLEELRGHEQAPLVNLLMLRSMMQAKYDPKNSGHYGLALDEYLHFTSPIRRYPDLLVHRHIKEFLLGKKKRLSLLKPFMESWAEQCSSRERAALQAERDIVDAFSCEVMKDRVGEVFEGRINGVTNFGLFIRLDQPFLEGLVHISGLRGFFQYHEKDHCLIGQGGKRYRLGDAVTIQVLRVTPERGFIDFALVEEDDSSGRSARRSFPKRGRRSRPRRKR